MSMDNFNFDNVDALDVLLQVTKNWKKDRDLLTVAEETLLLVKLQRDELEVRLDEAKEWYTVKRYARENGLDWRFVGDHTGRGYGWRKLKAISHEHDYEVQRSFDATYGEVYAFHREVFEMLDA
ncbi:hypothetical protein AGMMS49992_11860 [Clostridia bacterium]|nr:hypothetical protein AGMMS49992_11860 [Clostridia bacterium]